MSYILDALKRADAERERGHVPGLHSQSPSALTPPPTSARPKRAGAGLLAGASALLLLAATVWWWLSAPGSEQPPPTAVQAPAAAPVPEPPAAPPEPPAPPAPALPILTPAPAPAHAPAGPAPVVAPPPGARAATTPTPTVGTIGNGTGNGTGNVPSFAELPPDIRAQLPQVSVSGSTYSSNPAHRMLIANGKVVHEGEEIAPGLQLETIGPGKAVLNHRGTRYSIGY